MHTVTTHPLHTLLLPRLAAVATATQQQVMPDDHSELVPPLPIPNRTVKRLHADDSADARVKVGNRQASYPSPQPHPKKVGLWRLRSTAISESE